MSQNKKSLKGTWFQAIGSVLFPILLIFIFRWALYEPYVIPSGSMIPNLLVHDHILVKKFAYGIKIPFMNKWLIKSTPPERGQVVVFRYPENPEVFYVKRLIGIPGDRVEVRNNRIRVNNQLWNLQKSNLDLSKIEQELQDSFYYYKEEVPNSINQHVIRLPEEGELKEMEIDEKEKSYWEVYEVPKGKYFFMGDNRSQSSDGRVWGFVDEDLIVGKVSFIWLSCKETLQSMSFVCNPFKLRFERIFKSVN